MLQPMQNLFPIVYNLINRFALGNVFGDDYSLAENDIRVSHIHVIEILVIDRLCT